MLTESVPTKDSEQLMDVFAYPRCKQFAAQASIQAKAVGTSAGRQRSAIMERQPDTARAKHARAEVSRRLQTYYASLSLGLEDGAAELLDRVERLYSQREPEAPSHLGPPLT